MSVASTRAVPGIAAAEIAAPVRCVLAARLVDALWVQCSGEACGLDRATFEHLLTQIGMARNFGLADGLAAAATEAQQAAFFAGLQIADLVLARACAGGNERAWERFIGLYRAPLLRAGVAITGSNTLGCELADGLYAELYGLTEREGARRCPLDSYSGRGSLLGWLRTTLAQRHVDHHRRTRREEPLGAADAFASSRAGAEEDPDAELLPLLGQAVREALATQDDEQRFVLAAYFLDGRTLHQIAAVLGVHEATVSRKLKRATTTAHKQIVRNLERQGMSRRQAIEALQTDPRDLNGAALFAAADPQSEERQRELWKELLQTSHAIPFKEQASR